MTNIMEKITIDDMQTHIQNAFKILTEHLPRDYVADVQKKLGVEANVSDGTIRNIRNKTQKITMNKLNVLNALVEVALENKNQKERLIENINKLTK